MNRFSNNTERNSLRRKIFRFIALLLAALLLFLSISVAVKAAAPTDEIWRPAAPGAVWPESAKIKAGAWIVQDLTMNQTLLAKEPDKVIYPASLTKVMTCVLALEAGNLDRLVTCSATAVAMAPDMARVGLLRGEVLPLRDVVAAMMLVSGNDAANVIAEAIGGSIEGFVNLMNQRAAQLGMTQTVFRNPHGMPDKEHVTTVRDLLRLTQHAFTIPGFCGLVSTPVYAMPVTNKHTNPVWGLMTNSNQFLLFGDTLFQSPLIKRYTGVKTGNTNDAGKCLISSAETRNGHVLVSVLVGIPINHALHVNVASKVLLDEAAARVPGNPPPATTPASTTVSTTQTSPPPLQTTTTVTTATTLSSTATTTLSTPVDSANPSESRSLSTGAAGELIPDADLNPQSLAREALIWKIAFFALLPVILILLIALVRRPGHRSLKVQASDQTEPPGEGQT